MLLSTIVQKYKKDYPYGFFLDMKEWPNKIVPLGEEKIALYMGALRHERGMLIQRHQIFLDPEGYFWEIKPDDYFNGASVPRRYWFFVDPYCPKIRESTAFHDVYVKSRKYPQNITHRGFWYIQRANKVNKYVAWITWFCASIYCYFRYWSWR
jgi:hypothetical protein